MDERTSAFNSLYVSASEALTAGHHTEADSLFDEAATTAPELWCDIATKLAKDGREDAALHHFIIALQATKHAGIRSGIFNNIAVIYAKRGQLDAAIQMIDKSRECLPDNSNAWSNLAQIRKWQGDLNASNRYVAAALASDPWHNDAAFIQALNLLDAGNYEQGFPLYECRWRNKTNGYSKIQCFYPEWRGPGSTFHGERLKRLFVYCEQGAGDIFLMLRYAPLIQAAGMWQSWAVKPGMGELVASLVDHYSEKSDPPDDFDCHVPSASLPYIFKTTLATIPPCPYLSVPQKNRRPHPPVPRPPLPMKVGLAWRGNRTQANDAIRSTTLEHWLPVLNVPNVEFHSLQVDGADEALVYPEIITHAPPRDWSETAERLQDLDLLISADTGILHLAGAMGLPAWCALHCRPYFVFPVTQPGTPWYPTVKLYKQTIAHDWRPVFERIAHDLSCHVQSLLAPDFTPRQTITATN